MIYVRMYIYIYTLYATVRYTLSKHFIHIEAQHMIIEAEHPIIEAERHIIEAEHSIIEAEHLV